MRKYHSNEGQKMDEKKTYYEIITAAWDLLKKYYQKPEWDKIPNESIEITNRYKETRYFKFACEIMADVAAEINRRETEG